MIDTIKNIQFDQFQSRNVYADLFIPIMRRPGYKSGTSATHSLICVQHLGFQSSINDELSKISTLFQKLNVQKIQYICTHNKLEVNPSNELIQKVKSIIGTNPIDTININSTIENLTISVVDNSILTANHNKAVIITALSKVLISYINSDSGINTSKLINLTVKLFYWLEHYLIPILKNSTSLIDKESINHKIIHLASMTTLESYYLLMCFHLGFDVLHISFDKVDGFDQANPVSKIAQIISGSNFGSNESLDKLYQSLFMPNTQRADTIITSRTPQAEPRKIITTKTQQVKSNANNNQHVKPISSSLIRKKPSSSTLIKNKKFDGNLNSVLDRLQDRAGYVGLPNPIIPTYFVRYIGVDNNVDEYRNRIFNFDKKISSLSRNYIRIDTNIRINDYSSISNKTSSIWAQFPSLGHHNLDDLIEYLCGADVLDFIKDDSLKNLCYLGIKETLKIAFHGVDSFNTQKVKNLIIKLVGWLKDISEKLFLGYQFQSESNPKVMFYGDIKSHEALFLILLYNCGVDVIYVNSFQDDVFEGFDSYIDIGSVYTLDKVSPMDSFPVAEVMIQKQSTAYSASEEIAKIVHNVNDGVYLPWQFEKYNPIPITLKVTYDEIGILWNEQTRIREGFKVEHSSIYIPNMFVKISGTQENINEYWNFVSTVTSAKHTMFYTKLPFTDEDNFSLSDLSSVDTAFENHNTLSFEKMKAHKFYKYEHLSNELQKVIFDKIVLLINSDILSPAQSNDLKYQIVLSVLTLSEDLLKLIQNFDYSASIPKIVIYDNSEITFSLRDAITTVFLYSIGFDICVLTPTGYNNFEMYINDKFYQVLKLQNKQFYLNIPNLRQYSSAKGKGFWSSIFG